jgi:hypothetical protein
VTSCRIQEHICRSMSVWQGVTMDSLNFNPSLPSPTLLRPAGGPPLKRHYGRFGGGPKGQAACSRLLPFWTPHAVDRCRSRAVMSTDTSTAKPEKGLAKLGQTLTLTGSFIRIAGFCWLISIIPSSLSRTSFEMAFSTERNFKTFIKVKIIKNGKEIDAKALMVIGSLCPEGVIIDIASMLKSRGSAGNRTQGLLLTVQAS